MATAMLIPKMTPNGALEYRLPPSKSHMIRWLALASQSPKKTRIRFEGTPGEDIESMAHCLESLGVNIDREGSIWTVNSPKEGFRIGKKTLDCGNSATAAKFLMAMCSNLTQEVEITGDSSLQARDNSELANALRKLGVEVSSNGFPATIKGPISGGEIDLDLSKSSQPYSALLMASPNFAKQVSVQKRGEEVSRGYAHLSEELIRLCGKEIEQNVGQFSNWEVRTPDEVDIPGEDSLRVMGVLLGRLHKGLKVEIHPQSSPDIFASFLINPNSKIEGEVSLRDASDMITPVAAMMAIGKGGTIIDVSHARGKESDRIASTTKLLNAFGLNCEQTQDGLEILGNQYPRTPSEPIQSQGDHRLAMTAAILATACGAKIEGSEVCSVTHPEFPGIIDCLQALND